MLQLGIVLLIVVSVLSYVVISTSLQVDKKMEYVRQADTVNLVSSKQSIDSIYTKSLIDSKEKFIDIKISNMITDSNNIEKEMIDRFQRAVDIAVIENNINNPTCSDIVQIYENGQPLVSAKECQKIVNMNKNFVDVKNGKIVLDNNVDKNVVKSLIAQYDVSIDGNNVGVNNKYSLESKERNSLKIRKMLENSKEIMDVISKKSNNIKTNGLSLNALNSDDNSINSKIDISNALIVKSVKYADYVPEETQSTIKDISKKVEIFEKNISESNNENNKQEYLSKINETKNKIELVDNAVGNYVNEVHNNNETIYSMLDDDEITYDFNSGKEIVNKEDNSDKIKKVDIIDNTNNITNEVIKNSTVDKKDIDNTKKWFGIF